MDNWRRTPIGATPGSAHNAVKASIGMFATRAESASIDSIIAICRPQFAAGPAPALPRQPGQLGPGADRRAGGARRVVTFDSAGVGGSTGTTPDTIAQMARDAIAFIAARAGRSGRARRAAMRAAST
jgi:hypothetical protein